MGDVRDTFAGAKDPDDNVTAVPDEVDLWGMTPWLETIRQAACEKCDNAPEKILNGQRNGNDFASPSIGIRDRLYKQAKT